jgi:predicted aspartyl protease
MSRLQSAPAFSARQLQIVIVAVSLFLLLSLLPSAASPQKIEIAKPTVAGNLTAARVVSGVHKAIGYRKLETRSQARGPLTIPLELTNNLVIVELRINGSRLLAFILDTGASTTVISDVRANELGLKLEGQTDATTQGGAIDASLVKGASLNLAGIEFPNMTMAAIRLSGLEAGLGRKVDGILGYEIFNRFVVEIDYSSRVVRLYEPQDYKYSGRGAVIPIRIEDHTPFVVGRLTGPKPIEGDFLIDTGAPGVLNIAGPFAARHKLLDSVPHTISITSGALLAGRSSGKIGRVNGFQMGSLVIKKPVVNFSQDTEGSEGDEAGTEYGGLIGGEILRRFKLIIDYSRNRIILEPHPGLSQRYEFDMSGMSLAAGGENFNVFKVRALVENSPATEAALRVGDIITAIDGKLTAPMTLEQIRRMFRKEGLQYSISVKRDESVLQLKIKTRRLI